MHNGEYWPSSWAYDADATIWNAEIFEKLLQKPARPARRGHDELCGAVRGQRSDKLAEIAPQTFPFKLYSRAKGNEYSVGSHSHSRTAAQ